MLFSELCLLNDLTRLLSRIWREVVLWVWMHFLHLTFGSLVYWSEAPPFFFAIWPAMKASLPSTPFPWHLDQRPQVLNHPKPHKWWQPLGDDAHTSPPETVWSWVRSWHPPKGDVDLGGRAQSHQLIRADCVSKHNEAAECLGKRLFITS